VRAADGFELAGGDAGMGRRFGDEQAWAMNRTKHRWVRRQFARLGTVSQYHHGSGGGAFKGRLRFPWHVGVSSSVRMHGGRLERESGESLGWAVATRFGSSLSKETRDVIIRTVSTTVRDVQDAVGEGDGEIA
jgi:hypothetical protein